MQMTLEQLMTRLKSLRDLYGLTMTHSVGESVDYITLSDWPSSEITSTGYLRLLNLLQNCLVLSPVVTFSSLNTDGKWHHFCRLELSTELPIVITLSTGEVKQ